MTDPFEWIISVDDHIIEPPNVWTDRLPKKYLEVGPRIVRDDQGEAWVYEDRRVATMGLFAAAGRDKEEFTPDPLTYAEMRPGCYDSVARLEDMNRDGVLASMCFPTFPRFCGQTFLEAKDKELALLCVRAYNDWLIDEWCGKAPGRFIPCVIIPLWDPREAVTEIERCVGRGALAFCFSENPAHLGLPSIFDRDGYWAPVIATAEETGIPVCIHVGSSSNIPRTSPDSPMIVTQAWVSLLPAGAMLDWLFSGHLQRHPNLKICLSEGGIGWIPHFLEKAQYTYDRHRYWAAKADVVFDLTTGDLSRREASAYVDALAEEINVAQLFRQHFFGCFIEDFHGAANIDNIGIDNVMIETDYPHTDSSWPNSRENARKQLAGRSAEDVYKVVRGNAERVFRFQPAEVSA
jgi:predicted TIM-barrel fold metal-dependent hydrolase